jgi:hypothetical protein
MHNGSGHKYVQNFSWKALRGHFENFLVGAKIIVKWVLTGSGVDWIYLDSEVTLVNTLMNRRFL